MNGSQRYEKTIQVATFPNPGPDSPSGSRAQFRIPCSCRMIRQA
jgi:hypothetical protein